MAERCNAWLQDTASPWAGDTNLPETLQQRLTSITVAPPTDAEARAAAIVLLGLAIGAGARDDARDVLDECGLLEALRG